MNPPPSRQGGRQSPALVLRFFPPSGTMSVEQRRLGWDPASGSKLILYKVAWGVRDQKAPGVLILQGVSSETAGDIERGGQCAWVFIRLLA
jgi:hypothetical protein